MITTCKLKPPLGIAPNLRPGIKFSDGTWVTIMFVSSAFLTRCRAEYEILNDKWSHTRSDLQSGSHAAETGAMLQSMLVTLLACLSACAESRRYSRHSGSRTENYDLFPDNVGEWAEQFDDEISMAQLVLEETKGLIYFE